MMNAVMPVTIALVMAIVAGMLVWLVWSLIENLRATRKAKQNSGAEESAEKEGAADSR